MNIASLFRRMVAPAAAPTTPAAGAGAGTSGALDGRRFVGVVLEPYKTSGDADTLEFANGRFRSSACDQYGYGDGPYSVTQADGAMVVTARTESPKYGKLEWNCVIRGRRLDGTLTMFSGDRPSSEKWVVAGEKS